MAKERFASGHGDCLYKQVHGGAFDHIVIVTATRAFGVLRNELQQEVTGKVIAETAKDLTNSRLDEVEKRVKADLAGHVPVVRAQAHACGAAALSTVSF